MTCPYAVNRTVSIQTKFEYDDDGRQTFQQSIEAHNAKFLLCVREECGAWRDGRCQYREVN